MNKFVEFYQKAMADESVKGELTSILEGKEIDDASDAQLEKLVPIAEKLGLEITVDEAKEYLQGDTELSEDDLDAVAGGKGDNTTVTCTTGGQTECKYAGGSISPDVKVN